MRRWTTSGLSVVLFSTAVLGALAQDVPPPVPSETSSSESAVPSEKGGMTLEELVALAEASSPALRQAAASIESARGQAVQVGLYPNPILSGGANQIVGNQSQYYSALSQEIITRHKLKLNRAAAVRQVSQAEQSFIATRFQLLTTVRKSYMRTLAAQRRAEVLVRLVEIANKSTRAAEQREQAGEGTRPDTLLFEIELEKSEVQAENAVARLHAAQRELAAAMGLRDLEIHRINGNLTESLDAVAEQVLIDGFVPHNANVEIAELEVDRSRYLIRRAEVDPFPNVTVYAGYQRQIEPALHNMALLTVSVPLPLWNRNEGNIASAYANLNKASADVDVVQNDLARQMAELTGRYRVADQQVHRYESRIVPKARDGVRIIQGAFDQGQFDFLRLLQAQRILVESNLGYIDSLEQRWDAAAELAGLTQLEAFP